MKRCPKCNLLLELSMFLKCPSRKDGVRGLCIVCERKKRKEYRERNKSRILSQEIIVSRRLRERNKNNPERKEKRKMYNAKFNNKASTKEYYKNYGMLRREKNKERNKIRHQEYSRNHREMCNARKRIRNHKIRHTKDNTIKQNTLMLLLVTQNYECVYCKCNLNTNKKHLDHIIPLSKGGIHSITNVQRLCQKCNLTKSNKILS